MKWRECPTCHAHLDHGERCPECTHPLDVEGPTVGEVNTIYHQHKGHPIDMVTAAYWLGYNKAAMLATQDCAANKNSAPAAATTEGTKTTATNSNGTLSIHDLGAASQREGLKHDYEPST